MEHRQSKYRRMYTAARHHHSPSYEDRQREYFQYTHTRIGLYYLYLYMRWLLPNLVLRHCFPIRCEGIKTVRRSYIFAIIYIEREKCSSFSPLYIHPKRIHIFHSISMFCTAKIICHLKWFTNQYITFLFTVASAIAYVILDCLLSCTMIENIEIFIENRANVAVRCEWKRFWEMRGSCVKQLALEKFGAGNQIVNKTKEMKREREGEQNREEKKNIVSCFGKAFGTITVTDLFDINTYTNNSSCLELAKIHAKSQT